MPAYCAPCPGNRNATTAARRPPTTLDRRGRLAAAPRPRRPASPHTTIAPLRKAAPPDLQRVGDVGERRGRIAARGAPASRAVAVSSARRVCGRQHQHLRAPLDGARAGVRAGASSTTTCALVPPMPNELTPARRGALVGSHGFSSRVARRTGCPRSRSPGSARSKCRLGGSSPCFERQHRLDQAGDAGRRVEVADVALDRADRAAHRGRMAAERPRQRRDLDRIAERRAGAVRFDVADRSPARRRRPRARARSPRACPSTLGAV